MLDMWKVKIENVFDDDVFDNDTLYTSHIYAIRISIHAMKKKPQGIKKKK